jgi:hypothetical protein
LKPDAQNVPAGCKNKTSNNTNRHPKHSFSPNFGRIRLYKFFANLLRLADALRREPERFFIV